MRAGQNKGLQSNKIPQAFIQAKPRGVDGRPAGGQNDGLLFRQAGSTDVIASSYRFGGGLTLEAGTADKISVTINDDLTGGNLGVDHLSATFFGTKPTG